MAIILFIAVWTLGLVEGQHGHGTHVASGGVSQGEVDAAIVDLGLHYNHKLCLEILLVDCTKHVTTGDERVCGSNNITYDNHCRFAHARCEYMNSATPVQVVNHGSCQETTPSQTLYSTTADPLSSIIQNVFCQNMDSVSCANSIQIICGSDGHLYVNQCELSKAKCANPALTIADRSSC